MPCAETVHKTLVTIPDNPSDCWEWNGNINKKTGYGKKTQNGKAVLAHRWVFEMLQGPIPDGLVINHKCSNKSCVNPTHLEVIDQAGNCRHGSGTKLSKAEVIEIKRAKKTKAWGLGARLAKKFNVSSALIHDIWSGRAWKDIEVIED